LHGEYGGQQETAQFEQQDICDKCHMYQVTNDRRWSSILRMMMDGSDGPVTMGYRKILVTLDGSKLAELALKHVTHVAEPGGHVHLLSIAIDERAAEIAALASAIAQPVTLVDEHWPPAQGSADTQSFRARQEYLNQVSDWLTRSGFQVTAEVRPGGIVDAIVDVAGEGYEIIIMATHGRTGLSRVALGSVAEGVLRRSPCPVLIIPARAAKAE
jgi:nucleotide-binding universal stress UspA family protein